jgi:hypothetical protein
MFVDYHQLSTCIYKIERTNFVAPLPSSLSAAAPKQQLWVSDKQTMKNKNFSDIVPHHARSGLYE